MNHCIVKNPRLQNNENILSLPEMSTYEFGRMKTYLRDSSSWAHTIPQSVAQWRMSACPWVYGPVVEGAYPEDCTLTMTVACVCYTHYPFYGGHTSRDIPKYQLSSFSWPPVRQETLLVYLKYKIEVQRSYPSMATWISVPTAADSQRKSGPTGSHETGILKWP